MKFKWKNNLDERQEQKLLKIEHYSFWLFFWLIFLDIIMSTFVGIKYCYLITVGIFLIVSIFSTTMCIWNGIFDCHLKMGARTNILCSLIAGFFVTFVTIFHNHLSFSTDWLHATYAGLFSGVFTFILAYALLALLSFTTKKRQVKLEKEPIDDDQ